MEYANEEAESCELYRKWCGITTLAAALEQKVWLKSSHTPLYPNMYTLLVGPPAVGKSRTIGAARSLLGSLNEFPFAPTAVTMASLVDALKDAERHYTYKGVTHHYNSLLLAPDDLQVLMSSYDLSLIAGLTTFYDVNHPFREQKRTSDLRIEIRKPQLSILGGTTPSHLFGVIPEDAWSQGFTSRLLLVYSEERIPKRVQFNNSSPHRPVDLIHDLRMIADLIGEFHVHPDAEKILADWVAMGELPAPQHKRLEYYNGRRYPHLLKLSMVSSVDRGGDLLITVADVKRAFDWLIEVEKEMPKIFQAGPRSVTSKNIDEVVYFLKRLDPEQLGVPETKLKNFILMRVSLNEYRYIWEVLETTGHIKRMGHDKLTKEPRWTWVSRED